MKVLSTRVGHYNTADVVADKVLSYSLALARRHQVDLIDLPFRATSGQVARVQLMVGWMVDIDCVGRSDQDEPEMTDTTTADELTRRESALRAPNGDAPFTGDDAPDEAPGFDDY